jgi:hypothetical protein
MFLGHGAAPVLFVLEVLSRVFRFVLCAQGKAQRRINAVHVLDALILNGTDVRELHFNQR